MFPALSQRLASVAVLSCAVASPLEAQVLSGRVVEAESGRPVREASVALITPSGRDLLVLRADTAGMFRVPLAGAGAFQLRADAPGYAPRTWEPMHADVGIDVAVELRLSLQAVGLEPLVVTGRTAASRAAADEFYRRMQRQAVLGHGHFVTRDALDRGAQSSLVELLRRQPNVDVQAARRGSAVVALRRPTGGSCVPVLFIDGVRAGTGADLEHAASISSAGIEGIEIYRSLNETPVEMRNPCGAIAVWTRSQPAQAQPLSWRRMALGGALGVLMLVHFAR